MFLSLASAVYLKLGVLGDVILVREERPHTAQLEDDFAAVHNGQLVLAHQLFATLSSDEFKENGSRKEKSLWLPF